MIRNISSRCFICLVAVMSVLACGKEGLSGTVNDPFGNGIAGVSVDIVGTKFTATTDRNGHYSLEYAPGEFTVGYGMDGYTSASRTFKVSERGPLPVEDVTLYPVPETPGIYYLGQSLVRTPATEIELQKQGGRHKYYGNTAELITVPQGPLKFLDADGGNQNLAAIRGDGMILDVTTYVMGPRVTYGDFREDEATEFEGANLWLREVELPPGLYAWVDLEETPFIGMAPGKRAYLFAVEDKGTIGPD